MKGMMITIKSKERRSSKQCYLWVAAGAEVGKDAVQCVAGSHRRRADVTVGVGVGVGLRRRCHLFG